MFWLNSRLRSGRKELFDSFVPKPLDRHNYECNLYGYRRQPGSSRDGEGRDVDDIGIRRMDAGDGLGVGEAHVFLGAAGVGGFVDASACVRRLIFEVS